MPAASAFGALVTQDRPTSRGRSCFVSFLFRRQSAYTADGPRAGVVRLRRFGGRGDGGKRRRFQKRGFPRVWTLEWVQADSAGDQCRWLGVDAPKPHEQGGRQCRRPVPLARWSRKSAPRAGGRTCFVSFLFRRQSAYTAAGPRAGACRLRAGSAGDQCLRRVGHARPPHEQGGGLASFRFCSGGRAHTRQQAHEQGPAACGVFGDGEMGKTEAFPEKGIPKGLDS